MKKLTNKELEKYYITSSRDIIVKVARGEITDIKRKGFIEYNELMKKMGGPGRGYIGAVLEEVACNKKKEDEPIITAIVVHATDGKPGSSFWKIRCLPTDVKEKTNKEKQIFWQNECDKVRNYHW